MCIDQTRHEGSALGIKDHDISISGQIASVVGNFNDFVLFDPQRCSRSLFPGLGIQELRVLDYEVRHRLRAFLL